MNNIVQFQTHIPFYYTRRTLSKISYRRAVTNKRHLQRLKHSRVINILENAFLILSLATNRKINPSESPIRYESINQYRLNIKPLFLCPNTIVGKIPFPFRREAHAVFRSSEYRSAKLKMAERERRKRRRRREDVDIGGLFWQVAKRVGRPNFPHSNLNNGPRQLVSPSWKVKLSFVYTRLSRISCK